MGDRILIAGHPRAGKTTLAKRLAAGLEHVSLRHTDDLIQRGWSGASDGVARWISGIDAPFVIEGVAVPRALRKWLAANPGRKPCDVVYYLNRPFGELTSGQRSMAKGCDTVWEEIMPELAYRDVRIVQGAADFVDHLIDGLRD